MICVLGSDVHKKLIGYMDTRLKEILKSEDYNFDNILDEFTKFMYDLVLEKLNDEEYALSVASLVPAWLSDRLGKKMSETDASKISDAQQLLILKRSRLLNEAFKADNSLSKTKEIINSLSVSKKPTPKGKNPTKSIKPSASKKKGQEISAVDLSKMSEEELKNKANKDSVEAVQIHEDIELIKNLNELQEKKNKVADYLNDVNISEEDLQELGLNKDDVKTKNLKDKIGGNTTSLNDIAYELVRILGVENGLNTRKIIKDFYKLGVKGFKSKRKKTLEDLKSEKSRLDANILKVNERLNEIALEKSKKPNPPSGEIKPSGDNEDSRIDNEISELQLMSAKASFFTSFAYEYDFSVKSFDDPQYRMPFTDEYSQQKFKIIRTIQKLLKEKSIKGEKLTIDGKELVMKAFTIDQIKDSKFLQDQGMSEKEIENLQNDKSLTRFLNSKSKNKFETTLITLLSVVEDGKAVPVSLSSNGDNLSMFGNDSQYIIQIVRSVSSEKFPSYFQENVNAMKASLKPVYPELNDESLEEMARAELNDQSKKLKDAEDNILKGDEVLFEMTKVQTPKLKSDFNQPTELSETLIRANNFTISMVKEKKRGIAFTAPYLSTPGEDYSVKLNAMYIKNRNNAGGPTPYTDNAFAKNVFEYFSDENYGALNDKDKKDADEFLKQWFGNNMTFKKFQELRNGNKTISILFNESYSKDGYFVSKLVNENGKVTLEKNHNQLETLAQQMVYQDKVLANINIDQSQISYDGKIRTLNPYISFKLKGEPAKVETKQDKEEADKEVKKIIDDVKNNQRKRGKRPDTIPISKLDTQKVLNKSVTKAQEARALDWYNKSIFKAAGIPLNLLFNVVNQDNENSIATFSEAGITLYKGSDHTDLYHEAFHAFTQGFMTQSERDEIYDELENKRGTFIDYKGRKVSFKKATEMQKEEYLAEAFREYMIKGQSGVSKKTSPAQRNFFEKLYSFLKALFGKTDTTSLLFSTNTDKVINELFKAIKIGDTSNYTFNQNNQSYPTLNKGITAYNSETDEFISYKKSHDVIAALDNFIIDKIEMLSLGITEEADEIQYEEWVAATRLLKTPGAKISEMKKAKATVEKFDPLYKNKAKNYRAFSYVTQDEYYALEAYSYALFRFGLTRDDLIDQIDELKEELDENGNFKHQQKIVELTEQLEEVSFIIDEFGDIDNLAMNLFEEGQIVQGVIGYHMQNSKMFKTELLLETEDMSEEDQMTKSLKAMDRKGNDLSFKDSLSSQVLYMLQTLHKVDKKGMYVINEFNQPTFENLGVILNRLIPVLNDTLDPLEMYNKLLLLSKTTPYAAELLEKLGPYNEATSKQHNLWKNFWQGFNKARVQLVQVTTTQETKRDENNKPYNNEVTTVGVTSRSSDSIGLSWENSFQQGIIDISNEFFETLYDRDVLGYYLKPDAVLKSFKNVDLTKPDNLIEFYKAIGINLSNNSEVKQALETNFAKYNPKFILEHFKELGSTKVRDIESFIKLDNNRSENARYTNLKELESKFSDRISPFMVHNAEGNVQYEHSLHNTITIIASIINDKTIETYEDLVSNPEMYYLDMNINHNARASSWLKQLFYLDPSDKNRYGQRRIDPKTGEPVKLVINNLSGIANIKNENKSASSLASSDTHSKQVADLHLSLEGFFEFMRHSDKSTAYSAKIENSKLNIPITTPSNKRLNLAVEKTKPHIIAEIQRIIVLRGYKMMEVSDYDQDYIENGSEFVTFSDYLSNETNETLIKDINDKLNDMKDSLDVNTITNEAYEIALDLYNSNLDSIVTSGEEYFKNQVKENIKIYESKFISETAKTKGVNSVNDLVALYTYNSFLHNLETVAFFYGDLAMYNHKKEAFHKRNAGFGSTGTIYATDSVTLNYINSKEHYETGYAYKIKDELHIDGSSKWSSQMNTAIMEEMVMTSEYLDTFPEEVKPAYDGMDEADAQGLITFDAYRNLKISEGTWTDKHDSLFQKIITSPEKVSIADTMSYFPVIKAQYMGALDTGNKLPLTAMHKYSLFPLIPNVTKGKDADILHKKMIKENIGYVTFKSGSKVGTITKGTGKTNDQIYKDKATRTFNESVSKDGVTVNVDDYDENNAYKPFFTPNVINIAYLKNQLAINEKDKDEVIFSTQLRKLIIDGLMEEGIPTTFKKGEADRAKQWLALTENEKRKDPSYNMKRLYEDNIERLTNWNKQKLLNEFGWKNWIGASGEVEFEVGDLTKLLDIVKSELNKTLGSHTSDQIKTENGKLHTDLSLSLNSQKIEEVLNTLMSKRLKKQKVKGESLVQLASTFFNQSLPNDFDFTNASAEDKARLGQNLPFYTKNKDGSTNAMKVKVAFRGDFKKLANALDNDNKKIGVYQMVDGKRILDEEKTLEKLNVLLKDEAWLNTGDNRRMITMSGVRIPVQGMNSMEFMEVYEFLPSSAGGVIIPPTEIVAKSGADFDVDKMTVMMPNISIYNGVAEMSGAITKPKKSQNTLQEELDALYEEKKKIDLEKIEDFENLLGDSVDENLKEIKALTSEIVKANKAVSDFKNNATEKYSRDPRYIELRTNRDNLLSEHFDLVKQIEGLSNIEKKLKEIYNAEYSAINNKISSTKKQLDYYSRTGIENALMKNITDILSLPQNYNALITPNTTDLFFNKEGTGIADEMKPLNSGYKPTDNFIKENSNTFKGTKTLEWGYNLYKQRSNAIGKEALGMGAIDNTYNVLLTSIGFYLNGRKDYTETDLKKIPVGLAVAANNSSSFNRTLKLKHNKKNDGISLSHVKDVKGENSISDIINQLINGWVDIATEAWVFDIQASKEVAGPLLFMVQAGVPLKEAVYFVSNPLIKEYISTKTKAGSVYGENFKDSFSNPRAYQNEAKLDMFFEYFKEELDELGIVERKELDYKTMQYLVDHLASSKSEYTTLDANELEKAAKSKDKLDTEFNKEAFLHYLQLEEYSDVVGKIKTRTKFDTANDRTVYDTQKRDVDLLNLDAEDAIPLNILYDLKNRSSISSFNISKFTQKVMNQLFSLRINSNLNGMIEETIGYKVLRDQFDGDRVAMSNAFKNDLLSFMFQNELKYFDINDLGDTYKNYDVKYIDDEKFLEINGAGVAKSGDVSTLYISKKALDKLYDKFNKLSPGKSLLGITKRNISKEVFQNVLIERAILRDQNNIADVQSNFTFQAFLKKEKLDSVVGETAEEALRRKRNALYSAYEAYITSKAFYSIYDFTELFENKQNSYAFMFGEFNKKYGKNLQLELLNILSPALSKMKGNEQSTINLLDTKLTPEVINILHEELNLLKSESGVAKLLNLTLAKNGNEIRDIVNFFRMFDVYAVLQSGFNTSGKLSINKIVSQRNVIQLLADPANLLNDHLNLNSKSELKKDADLYIQMFGAAFVEKYEKASKRFAATDYNRNYSLTRKPKSSKSKEAEEKKIKADELTKKEIESRLFNPNEDLNNVTIVSGNDFTYEGVTIDTGFKLGEEQRVALEQMIDFVNNSEVNDDPLDAFVLEGSAGTGKTTIIGLLDKYLKQKSSRFIPIYAAPTHSAAAQLAFSTVKTGNTTLPMTVKSMYYYNSKTKEFVFTRKAKDVFGYSKPLVIIDESSMLEAGDVQEIISTAKNEGGKVIFMGDPAQIPSVNTKTPKLGEKKVTAISKAFEVTNKAKLDKIYRQKVGPFLQLLTYIRNSKFFAPKSVEDNNGGISFVENNADFLDLAEDDFADNIENTSIITYSNSSVKKYNAVIRKSLGKGVKPEKGDVLMGYVGYKNKQVQDGDVANSIKYNIKNVTVKENGRVDLVLESSLLSELEQKGFQNVTGESRSVYYQLSSSDSLNFELSKEQLENNNKEVSEIFREMDESYQENLGNGYNPTGYARHQTFISDKGYELAGLNLGDNYIYNPKSGKMELWKNSLEQRQIKKKQPELYIDKGIDYGYAITIHKSQGLTIPNVYFDMTSISERSDMLNIPIVRDGVEITTEANALYYVGMSRASQKIVVNKGKTQLDDIALKEAVEEVTPKPTDEIVNDKPKAVITGEQNKTLIMDGNFDQSVINTYAPLSADVEYLGQKSITKDDAMFDEATSGNMNLFELDVDGVDGKIKPEVKESIDNTIAHIKSNMDNLGHSVALYSQGYGQDLINVPGSSTQQTNEVTLNNPGLDTFKYLSNALLENFGYINPQLVQSSDNQILRGQNITDKTIAEEKKNKILTLDETLLDDLITKCKTGI